MSEHERIYRKDPLPDFKEIRTFMGKHGEALYNKIESFIDENYRSYNKEIVFGGKKFGVMVRWRNSGKTLCSIFPEKDGFSAVLVYGKKERETFCSNRESFSSYINEIYDNTKEYHDGRWMLIRIDDSSHLDELSGMIKIKKKPDKKVEGGYHAG